MTRSITVVVVDDHAVVRTGLEQLVEGWDDIKVVGSAVDGRVAVELLDELRAEGVTPDVVLMDLAMPVMDGVEATRRIKHAHPSTQVVILTSLGEQAQITAALDAGADGYLFKHAEPDDIAHAIRTSRDGGAVLDPAAARVLLDRQSTPPAVDSRVLSSREEQVIRLVHAGLANKQIARQLGIAERTVKAHLTNAFRRLGVEDRTQAAIWAEQNPPDHPPG